MVFNAFQWVFKICLTISLNSYLNGTDYRHQARHHCNWKASTASSYSWSQQGYFSEIWTSHIQHLETELTCRTEIYWQCLTFAYLLQFADTGIVTSLDSYWQHPPPGTIIIQRDTVCSKQALSMPPFLTSSSCSLPL